MTKLSLDEDVDFVITQSMNFDLVIEPFDDASETIRSDIDPATWRVLFQGRHHFGAEVLTFDFASDDADPVIFVDEVVTDPVGHLVRIHLNSVDTAVIPSGGVYSLARASLNDPTNIQSLKVGRYGLIKEPLS